ncbi:MAG: retron system putative HNH endonuclease [Candidatus Electrothrix sp.]
MIALQRADQPKILERKAVKWREKLLSATTKKQCGNAKSKYRHKDIKHALRAMCHDKCAYCESKVTHVDHGDIEHYRPKSKFPELTFTWSNLLLACGVCNGTKYKGDKFPEEEQDGPLVHPCEDDPSQHFSFHYEPQAGIASIYGITPRGETTEKILGLNRHALRAYRSGQIAKLYTLAQLADSDPEAAALFQEATEDSAEYSAFARVIKRESENEK